nr:MAG TPA: Helix-turn-helix XRE-family like protein [Caudoviricetes sp.]
MKRLRRARLAAGYTQEEMGRKLGLTMAGYRQKEVGERKITVEEAARIAEILGTSMDDIFLTDSHQND